MRRTHGMSHTRLHNIWLTMRQRCEKPHCSGYHKYGAKGIKVCEEWRSFEAFRDWAFANGYKENLTIDRKDPRGNYEPSNCRWSTQKEQQNNRSNNIFLTYKGETHSIMDWSEISKIPLHILYDRYYRRWEVDRIFEQPVRKSPKKAVAV
jgi:hypothetical protein